MTTLSEYNNNPGNLRPPKGVTYEGQIGVDDKGFAVFENQEFGRKALIRDILAKKKAGLNTPNAFIDRYAPPGKDEYGGENSEESRDNYKLYLAAGLGLKSTSDPFPEGSEGRIAQLIAEFEGRSTPSAQGEEPIPSSEDVGGETAGAPSLKERFKEQLPGVAGAAAGATAGTVLTAGQKAKRAMDLFGRYLESQATRPPPMAAPEVPSLGIPGTPQAPLSGAPGARVPLGAPTADAGRLVRGQTGTMPYNYAKAAGLTDIEAARALDMTKQAGGVHDLTSQRREALQRIQQLFPGESYVENPRFGGLMTPDQGAGGGPRQSFVTQGPIRDVPPGTLMGPAAPPPEGTLRQLPPRTPIPSTVTPPASSLLDEAIEKLGNIARGGLRVLSAPPIAGALGGYGAAMSGVEAFERERAGDRPGATLAASGGLGALAALPHPVARGVGLAASVMSPLSLMALDRLRKIRSEPAPAPATPEELSQAERPAFQYARP